MLNGRAHRGGWLQLPAGSATDAAVKPAPYLPIYEQLLRHLRKRAFTLLELGVWGGHSLQMWRDAFPRATIVGVDLAPPELTLGPRVHVIQGDQADAALMQRVRDELAPGGFDVIVDDASHIGITTARSLQVLYERHLRPGGIYVIEDWGTGYLPDWQDGGRMASSLDADQLDRGSAALQLESPEPISMPSHDLGAVGVVKRLIDHVARGTVRYGQPEAVDVPLAIDSMTIWDGIVVLRKPPA
ncbi:MAG TPA: class I SAM-dependent methyltransferase [Solirubrobacteraceae bacterium]|jgi:SAM-dependent methyltransferase|nr:class I SAM-dependent methyltransferase [Solirubrobacteraceae bacterium]